jgi:recombination protein RecT
MNAPVQTKDLVTVFKSQISNNEREFKAALPAHIPVERFMRVVTTAVTNNTDLLQADRRSLFEAATKAAQDGLLPDGREGALVIYNTKVKEGGKEFWIKKVQWMPMIAGILKKVRNSGELSTIVARVVYAGDKFRNWIDDSGEHIEYEAGDDQDQEIVRRVFAMAKLKDGSIEVEVLSPKDVDKIRAASRSKDKGPWVDWWEEMAKKSAIRRLSKRLPMSTDLDDLIRRDDALYDFEGAREEARIAHAERPTSLAGRLDALAAPRESAPVHDAETGEITQDDSETGAEGDAASQAAGAEAGARDSAGAASAADAAADEPDSRTEDEKLLDAARAKSLEGRRAFDAWFNRLRPEQIDALNPHMRELMAAAKQADGRA